MQQLIYNHMWTHYYILGQYAHDVKNNLFFFFYFSYALRLES